MQRSNSLEEVQMRARRERESVVRMTRGIALLFVLAALVLGGTLTAPDVANGGLYFVDTCADCHTYPPADATAGLRNTPEGAVAGTHGTHNTAGIGCGNCHVEPAVDAWDHSEGIIDVLASDINGDGGSYTLPSTTYNTTTRMPGVDLLQTSGVTLADLGDCSNFYCHSDGTANAAFSANGSWPTWALTVSCGDCHANPPATNAHSAHISAGAECGDCHSGAGTGATVPATNHVNRGIEVLNGYTAGGTPGNSTAGTCSTASCHTDGLNAGSVTTPAWNTTAACSECHAAAPSTGSHTVHLAETNCENCHDNAVQGTTAPTQHTDGNVDVFDATAGDLGYTQDAAIGSGSWSTCNNTGAACHFDGIANSTSPVWGTVVTDCSECHANQPTTGSHDAHMTALADCGDCHNGAIQGSTAPTANHRDGTTAADLNGYDDGLQTCNAASCHDDGLGNLITTPTWGTVIGCTECHAAAPSTGSHTIHLAETNCQNCHDGAVQGTTVPSQHLDGNVDVFDVSAGDLGYTQNAAKGTGSWSTCNNTGGACHFDGFANSTSPTWGTVVSDCSECHANEPATGSHSEHMAGVVGAACGDCHLGAVQGTAAPTANHRNGTRQADGNCNLCHNDGQSATDGNVGATNVAPPTWGTPSPCGICHAGSPTSAKHDEHLGTYNAICSDCHDNVTDGSTLPTGNHLNGSINVTASVNYTAAGTPGNGWGTCSDVSCHNPTTDTRAWDNTASGCASCHSYSPGDWAVAASDPLNNQIAVEGIGAHEAHVLELMDRRGLGTLDASQGTTDGYGAGQNASVCGVCHTNTSGEHMVNGRSLTFGDGSTEFQFGPSAAPLYNGSTGSGSLVDPKTCSNISCHFVETPYWSQPQ